MNVRPYASSWVYYGPFVEVLPSSTLRVVPSILQGRQLSLWWGFCCIVWLLWYPFKFFLSSPLVWWCPLPIFASTSKFPFLRFFSWFGNSIPSIICRFPLLTICIAHFSMPNSTLISWLYILTAFIRVSDSFSIYSKQFDVVCVHLVVNLFWRFIGFVDPCVFRCSEISLSRGLCSIEFFNLVKN